MSSFDNADPRQVSTLPSSLSPQHNRPAASRRHTTYGLEGRPTRSSPLAGPAIAVNEDGSVTRASADKASRPSIRSIFHTGSSPNVSTKALFTDSIVHSPTSGPTSPIPHSPEEGASADVHLGVGTRQNAKSSTTRRLSMGFKRLSSLPMLTSTKRDSPPHSSDSRATPARTRTFSTPGSKSRKSSMSPPVPNVPEWARSAGTSSLPSSPTTSRTPKIDISDLPPPTPRPTTAPSSPAQSVRRRSYIPSHHERIPGHSAALPASSPEAVWLSSAAPPRFSRMSLHAEGIVLPISVKEARRRSTLSMLAQLEANGGANDRGVLRSPSSTSSHTSLTSTTTEIIDDDIAIRPPIPPFRRETNASSSSIASSTLDSINESDSISPTAPSITRSSTSTELTEPRANSALDMQTKLGSSSEVEFRLNDVTVDVIGMSGTQGPARTAPEPPAAINADKEKSDAPAGGVERRRTLKKVWKRVVKTVKG